MDGWMVGLLILVGVVALFVIETMATWGLGGWMEYRDRRSARTREAPRLTSPSTAPPPWGCSTNCFPMTCARWCCPSENVLSIVGAVTGSCTDQAKARYPVEGPR